MLTVLFLVFSKLRALLARTCLLTSLDQLQSLARLQDEINQRNNTETEVGIRTLRILSAVEPQFPCITPLPLPSIAITPPFLHGQITRSSQVAPSNE